MGAVTEYVIHLNGRDRAAETIAMQHFFDIWRNRASFIDTLGDRPHEANVLLWSALDALAGHWKRTFHLRIPGDRRRMGDFLARHDGDVFARVSLPALWARGRDLAMEIPRFRGHSV